MYRLRLHPKIADDLNVIARLVAERSGNRAAHQLIDEIEAVLLKLSLDPGSGTPRDDIRPGLKTVPAGPSGVGVFDVHEDMREVHIHAVSYGGAEWGMTAKGTA